ncbi:hypothetical protein Tco_0668629 [Tanacetum coccineum]
MERMIAKAILQERGNIQAEISSQIQNTIDNHIPSQVDASVRSYMSGHILHVHPVQSQTPSVPEQQYQLYLSMKNDPQLQQQDIAIWLALQMKFENLQISKSELPVWVNKGVKKFNPYARYGVEHWKNPHAMIFYIKKQKEPGKPKERIYDERFCVSKVVLQEDIEVRLSIDNKPDVRSEIVVNGRPRGPRRERRIIDP